MCMFVYVCVTVYTCVHMCMSVYVCEYVQVCECKHVKMPVSYVFFYPSSCFPLDSLWMNLKHPIQLGRLATSSGFYLGAGALHWGLHGLYSNHVAS